MHIFPSSKLYFDVPILRFITVTIGIFSHDKLIIIYNKIKTKGFYAYIWLRIILMMDVVAVVVGGSKGYKKRVIIVYI